VQILCAESAVTGGGGRWALGGERGRGWFTYTGGDANLVNFSNLNAEQNDE